MVLSVKTHINHLNMQIHTSVETWTVIVKLGLCKNCDLGINKCFYHFDMVQ